MENKKLTTEEMASFRTTTGRLVGILLDLEKKTLQFWLNGKEQLARNKTVTEGYWLPATHSRDRKLRNFKSFCSKSKLWNSLHML